MAKTSKGIYYPYNYSEIADVPEDMKQMAESMNKLLEDKEVDEAAQNAKITTLQNKVNDLQQENNELSNNMPWNTTSGKSLHITDSAKYSKNRLSISGDMEQEKREGYNKLKIKDETLISKGITSTAKDEVLNIKGTTESDWFNITSDTNKIDLSLKANTTYKLKLNKSFPTKAILVLRMYEEGSSTVAQSVKIENGNKNVEFSTSKDLVRGYFFAYGYTTGETVNITDLQIMITEGTEDKPYEKYGTMPSTEFPSMPLTVTGVQKIRQFGKNFIPYPYADSTMTTRGINYVSNSDGSISTSGTSNSNVADFYLFGNSTDNGNYLHLKQDTYSLKDTGNTNIIYIAREKTLGALVGINTILQALKTQDCYFYGFFVRVNNGATVNTVIYPQLALGNTDTDYEPYWEKVHTLNLGTTQLCAIKDTNGNVVAKDRAVFRNGKWQWEKKIGKVILNGTEDYVYQNNARFYLKNAYFTDTNRPSSVMEHIPVSNFFEGKTMGQTWGGIEGISNDNNGSLNIACNSIATTVQEFKTWLSTHNLIVYYILETPQYIDCTAEQSVVLDKLYNNFELSKGTNNIIVENENGVGVNLELEYMQDNILKNNYKANEVNTGKKWIDGKDIYRRIVEVTNLSSGNNRIAHNISNFNELIDIRGTGNWNGNWQTIPRLVTDAVNTFGLGLGDINDTKFLIQVGTSYTNFTKAYIIIEYTKTIEVVE